MHATLNLDDEVCPIPFECVCSCHRIVGIRIKLFENLPASFDLIYNERKESAFGLKSLKLNIQLHYTGHYIWINQIHKEVFQLIEHALLITSHVLRLMCITILINPLFINNVICTILTYLSIYIFCWLTKAQFSH